MQKNKIQGRQYRKIPEPVWFPINTNVSWIGLPLYQGYRSNEETLSQNLQSSSSSKPRTLNFTHKCEKKYTNTLQHMTI